MGSLTNAQLLAAELAKFPQLNSRAVMAVAGGEGLGGGVGDNGTSFGPFQDHVGGALPSSVAIPNAQSWAWSPQGIDYNLRALVKAGGTNPNTAQAIASMVRNFERPANPNAEISGDLSRLGMPNNTSGIQGLSSQGHDALVQQQATHLANLQNILNVMMASGQNNQSNISNLLQNSQALLSQMNGRSGAYEPSNSFANMMALAGRTQPGAQSYANSGPSAPLFSGA